MFLILNIISLPSILIGKYFFKKWINPLTIYIAVWYFMITFYHIKLLNYYDLSFETWYVIIITYLAFLLGIITYFTARQSLNIKISNTINSKVEGKNVILENPKIAAYLTIGFGLVGLIGALQAWSIVLSIYGSIVKALLNLGALYQLRKEGGLEGVMPYTTVFAYVGIFFGGVHSGLKGRITLIALLPLVALVIKEVAVVGRAGILFGFAEYGFTFLYVFYLKNKSKKINFKLISTVVIAISIFIVTITFIKNLRGSTDIFSGKTLGMRKLENSVFISPSIYLYLSGHIGVLNKYLEREIEEGEIGENTLQMIYNILSKFDVVRKPDVFQKGYFIPLWMNTGTFIRELLMDFGVGGLLMFVYLLGIGTSLAWYNFFTELKYIYLVSLVYFLLIVVFSFLSIITRTANWFLSYTIVLGIFYSFQNIKKSLSINLVNQNDR